MVAQPVLTALLAIPLAGEALLAGGEREAAIEMYEKALERNPAMVTAMKNLATVYREGLGDEERAADAVF